MFKHYHSLGTSMHYWIMHWSLAKQLYRLIHSRKVNPIVKKEVTPAGKGFEHQWRFKKTVRPPRRKRHGLILRYISLEQFHVYMYFIVNLIEIMTVAHALENYVAIYIFFFLCIIFTWVCLCFWKPFTCSGSPQCYIRFY